MLRPSHHSRQALDDGALALPLETPCYPPFWTRAMKTTKDLTVIGFEDAGDSALDGRLKAVSVRVALGGGASWL
jgi:hypothetical protein